MTECSYSSFLYFVCSLNLSFCHQVVVFFFPSVDNLYKQVLRVQNSNKSKRMEKEAGHDTSSQVKSCNEATLVKENSAWLWTLWYQSSPKTKLPGKRVLYNAGEGSNTWKRQGMYPTPGHLTPAHHIPQQLQVGMLGDCAKPLPPQQRKKSEIEYRKATCGCFPGSSTFSTLMAQFWFFKDNFYNFFNVTAVNTFRFIDWIFCYKAKNLKINSKATLNNWKLE